MHFLGNCFFSDKVVFVEGAEDVHLIEKFASDHNLFGLELFGYGAGGAENIEKWLQACRELGVNAGAIYDKNKEAVAEKTRKRFPEFSVHVFPTDDIRDKPAKTFSSHEVEGMFSASGEIKPEYEMYLLDLLNSLTV